MRKVLKTAKFGLMAVYILCGIALAVFLIPQTGMKALSVATPSMSPALPPGSLVIIRKAAYRSINPGDVITFTNPANAKQTITHRVVETKTILGLPGFVTKGDANKTNDQPILGGNIVGKLIWHAPVLGSWLNNAKQPIWIILLVGLPGLLIMIDELRILMRTLVRENSRRTAEPAQVSRATLPEPARPPVNPKSIRRIDSVGRIFIFLVAASLAVGTTRATLISNTVSLTNNSFTVRAAASHLLINQVFIGGAGDSPCPASVSNISINNTGPGSNNNANVTNNCTVNITNSNTITITNSAAQISASGDSSSSGNTNGGSVTSGSASNSSTTTTAVIISSSTASVFDTQWIEMYNPTAQPISLAGWKIIDNSGIVRTIGSQTIASHGFALIAQTDLGGIIGNGLSGAGDRLILRSPANAVVDAVSWGSDVSQLNPSVAAIPVGGSIKRLTLGLDSDAASDWMLAP